jgi:allantoinase
MPLNSVPPTTNVANLDQKRAAADGQVHVDVAFWGGATPDSLPDLDELAGAGVVGVKGFLPDSGVPEFGHLEGRDLVEAVRRCAELDLLLAVHAEDPAALLDCPSGPAYSGWLASRPARAETAAVERLARLASEHGARIHVVHVSAADAADALAAGMTAETCPHYLVLRAEDVPDGATAVKCAPPVREDANRERLWQALAAGLITTVVSDHSPAPPELKETGDFASAWGGIASLQLGLPLVWTEARTRGHDLADVMRWMAETPARLAGLPGKGAITVGNDADLVAFDPDAELVVDPTALHHRHAVSPYGGRRLTGVVRTTWLRGSAVDDVPRGRLLRRGERVDQG